MNVDKSHVSNLPEGPTQAAVPTNTLATATDRMMLQDLWGVDIAAAGFTIQDDTAKPSQAQGKGAAASAKALTPTIMAGGEGIEADEAATSASTSAVPLRDNHLNPAQQKIVTAFADSCRDVKLQTSTNFVEENFQLLPPTLQKSYTAAKESVDTKEREYIVVSQRGTALAKTPGTAKQDLEAVASHKKEIGKTLVELKAVQVHETKSAHRAILETVAEQLINVAQDSNTSDQPFRTDLPHLSAFNKGWKTTCRDNGLSNAVDTLKAGFKDPFAKIEAKGKEQSPILKANIKAALREELSAEMPRAERKVVEGLVQILEKETKAILKTVISHLEKTHDPNLASMNNVVKQMADVYHSKKNEAAKNPEALTTNAFCLRVLTPQVSGDMTSTHNVSLGIYLQESANQYLGGVLKDQELNQLFDALTKALTRQ